jgi:hypothetical protein
MGITRRELARSVRAPHHLALLPPPEQLGFAGYVLIEREISSRRAHRALPGVS